MPERRRGGKIKHPKPPSTQPQPSVKPDFEILPDGIRIRDRTLRLSNIPANLAKTLAFAIAVGSLAPAAAHEMLSLLIGNGDVLYKVDFNHPTFNETTNAIGILSSGRYNTTNSPSGPMPAAWQLIHKFEDRYTNHETYEEAHFASVYQGYVSSDPEIVKWINSTLEDAFKTFSDRYSNDIISPAAFATIMAVFVLGMLGFSAMGLCAVGIRAHQLRQHADYEAPEHAQRKGGTGEGASLLGSSPADAAAAGSDEPPKWSITSALRAVGFMKPPPGDANFGGDGAGHGLERTL